MHLNLSAARIISTLIPFFFTSILAFASNSIHAQKITPSLSSNPQKFELTYIEGYPVIFIDTEEGSDIRFDFSFNVGGLTDEKHYGSRLSGISHFLEHTLTTSSMKFPYVDRKIWEILKQTGKDVNAVTGTNATKYYWLGSEENGPRAMEMYSNLIFNPEFNSKAIEIERSAIQDEKTSFLENRSVATYYTSNQVLYAENSAYRYNVIGSTESIAAIQRTDLIHHWNQFYGPNNAIILIAGNFSNSPSVKANLKQTLEQSIHSSYSNPYYSAFTRETAKDLPAKLNQIKPIYRDSKFRKILIENSDKLPELTWRLTLELDPKQAEIHPMTFRTIDYLLSLESPENPIYLLKEKGISTLPDFNLELSGNELRIDVSITVLNQDIAQELERGDQSVLNFLSEVVLTRITQLAEGVVADPYYRFVKNLVSNDIERTRSSNSSLSSSLYSYQNRIGTYQLTWEKLVESYNQLYSQDANKVLDTVSKTYIAQLLSNPIRKKSYKMHWYLTTKAHERTGNEPTPFKGISIASDPEDWEMDSQNFAELNYAKISPGLREHISQQKESHLASELLNLTFNHNSQHSLDEKNFELLQYGNLNVIKQNSKVFPKHQNIVIRFSNEAEDELSIINLEMFLASFNREYSKELTIVQSYLTSLFINPRYMDGKQVIDFSFTGEPAVITELAPKVLSWFKQHETNEKSTLEIKQIFSNQFNSQVTGNIWNLAHTGQDIRTPNFLASLEGLRYYLSEAQTFEPKDLNAAKQILDGAEVTISLVGNFSNYQVEKIKEGATRIVDRQANLVVAEGTKKRRTTFENLDIANRKHIQNQLPPNISSKDAVVVLSSVQVNQNIHVHSYLMSKILSKMLSQHVFAINREEKNLGYYHSANFDLNQEGLHMIFAGKVESTEDPFAVKNMLQQNWKEAAARILRNEDGDSFKDFNTILQSMIYELTSPPKSITLAFMNLNSWTDFHLSNEVFRAEALKILRNTSFERDIVPLVKELLPEYSNSNRLTYMIGGGCEHLFRDRIRD